MFGVWNEKKKKPLFFGKAWSCLSSTRGMGFRVRSAEGRTLLTRSGHTHSVWLDQTVRGCSLPFHERSGEHDFPFAGCTRSVYAFPQDQL